MPDPHPQDQPQPKSRQDWNEVSAAEIEQTISNAAELAYELAGDIGQANVQAYRDTSGLEPIETALDVELKQLDHLVRKTQEQLEDLPGGAEGSAAVPDFMSEFLTGEPVTIAIESNAKAAAQAPGGQVGGQADNDLLTSDDAPAFCSPEQPGESKMGLVGIGTLGVRKAEKKTTLEEPPTEPPPVRQEKPQLLRRAAFWLCDCGVRVLELIDRPLAGLQPSTRRALSVTAIAAFCTCLTMFLLSLLFS